MGQTQPHLFSSIYEKEIAGTVIATKTYVLLVISVDELLIEMII